MLLVHQTETGSLQRGFRPVDMSDLHDKECLVNFFASEESIHVLQIYLRCGQCFQHLI